MNNKRFLKFDICNLPNKKISGLNTEADIYVFNKYVLKVFRNEFCLYDKKYTLKKIDENRGVLTRELPELLLPSFYISINNKFCGYGMKYISGLTLKELLEDKDIDFNIKINYLIKVGNLLDKMGDVRDKYSCIKDLFLNDLQSSNIICLPNGEIKVIDIDSISICNNRPSTCFYLNDGYYLDINKYGSKYNFDYGRLVPNIESDLYCYIMIILEFLSNCNLKSISDADFNKILNTYNIPSELIDIFTDCKSSKNNINPKLFLKKISVK